MDNQVAMLLLKQLQEIHLLLVNHFNKTPPIAQVPSAIPEQLHDLIDEWDVLQVLKISRSTMYRLKASSQLHTIKIGNKTYFSKSQIESLKNKYLR